MPVRTRRDSSHRHQVAWDLRRKSHWFCDSSLNISRGMRSIINIEDLRQAARRRLPRVVFDYMDGGAEAEVTLRENPRSFEKIFFRPRQAVTFPEVDLTTTVLGTKISFPALLAPIGYSRLLHPEGERGAARAAGNAGTGY